MDLVTFVRATGVKEPSASIWLAPMNGAMTRFSIDTLARQAAFLAQTSYESRCFPVPPVEESFNYSISRLGEVFRHLTPQQCESMGRRPGESAVPLARQILLASTVYGNRQGNGPASTQDGWKYRGSGLIQLTFRDNFKAAGDALGMDLVSNPDFVREDPTVAALVAGWYWSQHGCNELADHGDFFSITAKINPGMEGEVDRARAFAMATHAMA
ncbi:glycoside hydrolase family 19 protein [Cupriavidus sp. KB_39]|uniref:glycoside hydrolase family 19 protein n=1 Tax=Cupriavidus sp. KB_39 TaxID=3233036 RepID=UPI003F922B6E